MNYEVKTNDPNVSTTQNGLEQEKTGWTLSDLYENELTVESLIETLQVTDALKRKYTNDETIRDFEDIIRDEICQMFGGSIINEI